jgi:hypothetical protein
MPVRKLRRRSVAFAAAIAAALSVPATASAYWWQWGFNHLTYQTTDPNNCKWYYGEVCAWPGRASPPDWYVIGCDKYNGDKIHCGWERPDTWVQRGVFMTGAGERSVTVIDTGWQGQTIQVQPEATWWEGNSSYMRAIANPGGP